MFQVWDGVGGGRSLQTYSAHRGSVRDACWLACGRRLLSGSFDGSAAVTDVETGELAFWSVCDSVQKNLNEELNQIRYSLVETFPDLICCFLSYYSS